VFPETAADPAPTPQSESQETCSGGGSYDVTTRDPPHDLTDNTFTFEYEDTTHSQPMDRGGVLGPGAIAAIVIAVILGASVLIALVVITLKRFTTA
uniref:Secondary ossification center associated regulator of chondrocyte maturation n=1 Tax=Lepisosteus oculatus TaxID=7918 RepID=W5MS05_LEPOC